MSNVIESIELGVEDAISIIDTFLPIAEKAIPALAPLAGPIGLGVSAAAALLPLLAKIPIGPTFTVEMQASYLERIKAVNLLDFSDPVWKPSASSVPASGNASAGPSVTSGAPQAA